MSLASLATVLGIGVVFPIAVLVLLRARSGPGHALLPERLGRWPVGLTASARRPAAVALSALPVVLVATLILLAGAGVNRAEAIGVLLLAASGTVATALLAARPDAAPDGARATGRRR